MSTPHPRHHCWHESIRHGLPLPEHELITPQRDQFSTRYHPDDGFAVQQLVSVIRMAEDHLSHRRHTKALEPVLRTLAPYTAEVLQDGSVLPLNRSYKPLGLQDSSTWIDYQAYSHLAFPAAQINEQWAHTVYVDRPASCRWYLFNDSCSPWRSKPDCLAYLARLRLVFGLGPQGFRVSDLEVI